MKTCVCSEASGRRRVFNWKGFQMNPDCADEEKKVIFDRKGYNFNLHSLLNRLLLRL